MAFFGPLKWTIFFAEADYLSPKVRMCSELASRFKTGAQECLDLTVGADKADTDTACACWTHSDLAGTVEAARVEWSTLIGPDLSRYSALIG